MTKTHLHQRLNSGRLNKDQINTLVSELILFPQLTGALLDEVFEQDHNGESFNASWVFDHLMRKRLTYLLPYLDSYVKRLPNLKSESCTRPMVHVLEMLNTKYFKSKDPTFVRAITPDHQEIMLTVCFDWLIGEHKVAAKVFAMTNLFYLGEKYTWVWPELKSVLEQQIPHGTAGFKSRGGKILNALKKLGH